MDSPTIVGQPPPKQVIPFRMVGDVREKLGAFVRRTRHEKGLSTLDVERKSNFKISDGYVSRIENEGVKNVSPQKLTALAKGLGATEEELFAVVRGKDPNEAALAEERFRLLSAKFSKFTGEKKTRA